MRISNSNDVIDKGYMPILWKEHFTVCKAPAALKGSKCRLYKISEYNCESVTKTWYDEKLQHILNNQNYIERVICWKTAAICSKEILVKWEG